MVQLVGRSEYKHFKSDLAAFVREHAHYSVASINNHALELRELPDASISRFVRDPRDLVVSGYFYHRQGTERWTQIVDPRPADWINVNGVIPKALRPGESLHTCLNRLSIEDGLIAEVEFRRYHFESMAQWKDDPRVRTWKYRDVIGHEADVFREIASHYGMPEEMQNRIGWIAHKNRAEKRSDHHVRDPTPGQWQSHFTPKVHSVFDAEYGALLDEVDTD